ncbi:acetoacetate decarboxylase [Oceanibacterium hippocampi]|uniref:Putative acetoacetate decarboxylase n=1 Tax=Oceanibacterium hippocampi TaxID=745714 RepID=A0A1Y5S280_9PROT|nr:acetoacetate decarboxylase [Oceanibacterium hippocampi]SLN30657.1 putative acetoacetate decarboxylase [Oceanibacterium hippocampi]
MNREQILGLPSMPAAGPSYPFGPYRFVDREYMIIIYESDPDAIRAAVPEPLVPDASNQVFYEWIKMPDSSGFGDYTESGVVIPCHYEGTPCNFVAQMYLDDDPPIAAGREIWGFPKKYAHPKMAVQVDTLTGTLDYSGVQVAMGTMAYKWESHARDLAKTAAAMTKMQVNLKLIPDVDGKPAIAQLVKYNLTEVTVKGSWSGPARLHLIPHVNAPVADLPVRRIVTGRHFVADLTLPYGEVLLDYLK